MRLLLASVLACLVGCDLPDDANVDPVNSGVVVPSGGGVLQLETDRYSIDLQLPEDLNPIARSDVQSFLQEQVDALLVGISEEPEPGYFTTHQYELSSKWETVKSTHLYAILVRGRSYTGGAHGMPFVQTFTYSKSDDQKILLAELLNGEDSLRAISEMALVHFKDTLPIEMAEEGLSPDWSGWRNWLVTNNKITFLFPVYQIAPYSEGEQKFSVVVDPSTSHLFNLNYFEVSEQEIQITDEHGHGPDPGSEEAAYSAAWQLISRSPAYIEDGHSLEITRIRALPKTESGWLTEYSWKHYGDPDGQYSGQVRVLNDRPEFVD